MDSLQQRPDESDDRFQRRKHERRLYHGRLIGTKLTGDVNVPRGETTFIVHDLSNKGIVKTAQEAPFQGARVVDCEGHISDRRVGEALMGLKRLCADVRFLGSYPRADRVRPEIRQGTSDADFQRAADWLTRCLDGRTT